MYLILFKKMCSYIKLFFFLLLYLLITLFINGTVPFLYKHYMGVLQFFLLKTNILKFYKNFFDNFMTFKYNFYVY